MITSNIKRLMKEKRITLRRMSAKTGLAEITIRRARCELIAKCRLETLEAIAVCLECEIKDLFDEKRV